MCQSIIQNHPVPDVYQVASDADDDNNNNWTLENFVQNIGSKICCFQMWEEGNIEQRSRVCARVMG